MATVLLLMRMGLGSRRVAGSCQESESSDNWGLRDGHNAVGAASGPAPGSRVNQQRRVVEVARSSR